MCLTMKTILTVAIDTGPGKVHCSEMIGQDVQERP